MRNAVFFSCAVFALSCAGGTERNPLLVATEQRERLKPQLLPPGGTFYGNLEIRVLRYRDGLVVTDGSTTSPLVSETITIGSTRTLTIRDAAAPELSSSESYTAVSTLPPVTVLPAPGSYAGAQLITAHSTIINARIEYSTGGAFIPYDTETGIAVTQSSELVLRACVGGTCSPPSGGVYTITERTAPTEPIVSAANLRLLTGLAQQEYNQLTPAGLTARLDEAKLLVIADGSLLTDASLRSRFLAQHNDKAAAGACTTVARYLYLLARRFAENRQASPVLPNFAEYYIRHIRSGDIAQDSEGNFVWIMNGANLVTPYLADDQKNAFEYRRGSAYPTDFSLLDPVYASKPSAALLRDSPNATAGTHTFAAVRTANGYTMLDTYFAAWNGVEARATAGEPWPFGYRFGPAGSRYLHFTYGY